MTVSYQRLMSSLINSCESTESCFVSSWNESGQLELKPISRGMHVTHNGVNELSKLKPNSSARFRLRADRNRWPCRRGDPERAFRSPLLRPRNPHVSQPNGAGAAKKTKAASELFLSLRRNDIQLSRQATSNNGISACQIRGLDNVS